MTLSTGESVGGSFCSAPAPYSRFKTDTQHGEYALFFGGLQWNFLYFCSRKCHRIFPATVEMYINLSANMLVLT